MKRLLLESICLIVRFCGMPTLIREIIARRRVTIINYHDPTPGNFLKHMKFFKRHYNIISLDQLYDALKNDEFDRLPPKSMVVTLDDGHVNNFSLLESIKYLRVPITIYAVAGVIGTNRHYWFKSPNVPYDEIEKLKRVSDKDRRTMLRENHEFEEKSEFVERQGLSINDLLTLQDAGVVIGSHTMTHPLLSRCTQEVVQEELQKARKVLEEIVSRPVLHFAYPGGDYNEMIRDEVGKAGYITARTIQPGFVMRTTHPLALPNLGIADDASLSKAIVQASGFWAFIKYSLLKKKF